MTVENIIKFVGSSGMSRGEFRVLIAFCVLFVGVVRDVVLKHDRKFSSR